MHPLTFAATHSDQHTQTDLGHANLCHLYLLAQQTRSEWSQVSDDDKENRRGPLHWRWESDTDQTPSTTPECVLHTFNWFKDKI